MARYPTELSRGRLVLVPAIAVVLAVLFWSANRSGMFSADSSRALAPVDSTTVPTAMPAAVSNYLGFTNERSASEADVSHNYSADGFRHLANALETLTGRAGVVEAAREIRARADSLQHDQTVLTHARQARLAAIVASDVLGRIPETASPEWAERIRQLKEAASAIDAEKRLLQQATLIQAFFVRSAQVIGDLSSL